MATHDTFTATPAVPGQRSGTASTGSQEGGGPHPNGGVPLHGPRGRNASSLVGQGSMRRLSPARAATPFSPNDPGGAAAGPAASDGLLPRLRFQPHGRGARAGRQSREQAGSALGRAAVKGGLMGARTGSS